MCFTNISWNYPYSASPALSISGRDYPTCSPFHPKPPDLPLCGHRVISAQSNLRKIFSDPQVILGNICKLLLMAHKVLHCSIAPSLAIVMFKVLVVPQTCYSLPQKSVFKPLSARNILYPLLYLVKSHTLQDSAQNFLQEDFCISLDIFNFS